ncbi:hypothetical protein BWQ96_07951 [Gracilariopsis chorda]|uniref:Uncharacterized protein n=1 Tax=Gracilariopsis chorda TaxID=448386 RepID=A0A2V3IJP5_9FLOR|nr:hypothetical protein BWQ96_07951 [Gracilariopsis chorda]|eukprot:PXF42316.1 hypothetical protein BWQ96_07951 [Gracilariopsis chorda]
MVDEREIMKQYSYKATSKLVIENEKRRPREQSASITALQASNMPGRMGDRVASSRRPQPAAARVDKKKDQVSAEETKTLADQSVLDVAKELDLGASEYTYVPTTRVSQRAFEALLAFIMSKLGDQPRELLRSAADEVLASMKDDNLQEIEKKKVIEELFGNGMTNDEFTRLTLFCSQIRDYKSEDDSAEQLEPQSDDVLPVLRDVDEEEDDVADEVVELDDMDDRDAADDDDDFAQHLHIDDNDIERKEAPLEMKTIDPRDIDGEWLERQLGKLYEDKKKSKQLSNDIMNILSAENHSRMIENELASLLEFDKLDFISLLLDNRKSIVYCTKLARAKDPEERRHVEEVIRADEDGEKLLESLNYDDSSRMAIVDEHSNKNVVEREKSKKRRRANQVELSDEAGTRLHREQLRPSFALRKLDIESLKFQRGSRLMTVRDCKLPEGSEHVTKKDYEEWHIPAVRAVPSRSSNLISVNEMPSWTQPAFANTKQLNRMQSEVFPCAFESDENMLLCAPTGAGKTNVAVLTILKCVANSMPKSSRSIQDADLTCFKVIYVAPMKALVAEVVENLSKRLGPLGLEVRELTGDVGMTKQEIENTQVIVTTPEKWDIVTRKSGEKTYTSLVRLLIVDEIHLLHDERGPVIESLVARTSRNVETMTASTRVVGLSATLPNYKDVAMFLQVEFSKGLFYFDSTHRPCPLQQCYVGITAKRAFKRFQLMNDITYEKVKLQLQTSNQVIIFVHSRKETSATCRLLVEKAIEDEIIDQFLNPTSASYEIVQSELAGVNGKELANVLEHGLATHHAGMTRNDRQLVEALFEAGHIKVLVSTATLAWGVNLPAHAVIIKGTQVYSPEQGRWIELSSMDVMQMMGRAGRPQFDTFGEGYIITSKADVLYYLSLLNDQLPIESQFVSKLVDMLNAEVATGSVTSVNDGSQWLCYTYLYVRMVKDPALYGVAADEHHQDKALERRRAELIHAAATELHRCGLVKYNKQTGEIVGTPLGRIASDFYVSHESMSVYSGEMKSTTTDIDLLRIFSMSNEFEHMQVREEEKLELARLAERIPVPIKESLDEPTAKVSVLLQSHISKLGLDGLALKADMVYVTQSAGRLARALLEVAAQGKWASLFDKCLNLSKSVSMRQWPSQTPLRQFGNAIGEEVLHRIERKDIPFERYYDLTVSEVGELLRDAKLGKTVHRLIHSLPRMEIEANVRPLSRSTLEIELTLIPDFRYDRKIHKSGEGFWIVVEDADSEILLHSELFFLRPAVASEEHSLTFTVKLTAPQPPQYFIRCSSDRWIAPPTVVPLSFRSLVLPEKFVPYTRLLDTRLLSVAKAFSDEDSMVSIEDEGKLAYREAMSEIREYFARESSHLTRLQTQLFDVLFESETNSVVASLPGEERDKCGELCVARLFSQNPTATAVWVVGRGEVALDHKYESLVTGLGKHLGLSVGKFQSDRSEEISFLRSTSGALVFTTPERWDMFSRRWRQKREGKIIKKIRLIILDGVHHLSEQSSAGSAMEVVGSRARYMAAEAAQSGIEGMRIIALSDPIANARDIGHWIGAPPAAVFSFHPKSLCRDLKLEVIDSTFRRGPRSTRAASLAKPVFNSIQKHIGKGNESTLVFVSSRKMAKNVALELTVLASQGGNPNRFGDLSSVPSTMMEQIQTRSLRQTLSSGVGYVHENLDQVEQAIAKQLFAERKCTVLVATSSQCWRSINSKAYLVVVAGTSYDDNGAYATRRAEYSSSDLLKMVCSTRDAYDDSHLGSAVVITDPSLREHYETYTLEPLPVESQLRRFLADHFNAEIEAGVIESKQEAVDYLTWTFFYRRLPKNPNYYGMNGTSPAEISNNLSELVETALSDLESSRCIAADAEEDVSISSLNIGRIAAHFYIRHATVELFASSITPKTKLRGLIDILSLASEFGEIPVRLGDEDVLRNLAARVPVSLEDANTTSYSSPHVKAHLLLQAHLTRESIPYDFLEDQKRIVLIGVRLLRAMVDVIASNGWLKPVLAAIELGQMLVQGLWDHELPLMQLPHIDKHIATTLKEKYDVTDIFGFLEMEDNDRADILKSLSSKQVMAVSEACQLVPNLDDFVVESVKNSTDDDGLTTTRVMAVISRSEEEEAEDEASNIEVVPTVSAPLYPDTKEEGWWVIVGNPETNTLLNLKFIALKQRAKVKLVFDSPPSGHHSLQLYLLSDSYIDCDQEDSFVVDIS